MEHIHHLFVSAPADCLLSDGLLALRYAASNSHSGVMSTFTDKATYITGLRLMTCFNFDLCVGFYLVHPLS